MEETQQPMDMNYYVDNAIPKALSELMENHSKMQQISTYCKNAYVSGAETNQVYEQTQSYAKNAILNVAYHIQNIGSNISTLLDLQSNEIKRITSEIQTLTQKVNMVHEISGANAFASADAAKAYKSALKERKVEVESAKLLNKFVRKQVNYAMGAEGGLDRSASSSNLNSSTNSSTGMPPPPSTSNSSTPSYQSPTYSPQPPHPTHPTLGRSKPPPPSLSVPPTMSSPIPTRPVSVQMNIPPPPPPSNFDMPPPPINNTHLPPPPSVHGLPPPPSTYDLPPPPMRPISHYGYDLSELPPPPHSDMDLPPPPPPM